MHIRIITGQAQPGQMDELARQWKENFATQLRTMAGFAGGQFAGDRATDTVVGVTQWTAEPDLAVLQQHLQTFMGTAGHLVAGRPQAAVYEVLQEA